jgi:ERCC4-related helicase
MLKNFDVRKYQLQMFNSSKNQNTLIVLPTGLGKTAIAMLLSAHRLLNFPNKKILFLAPTKPLAEQQFKSFKENFLYGEEDFILLTGEISPSQRKDVYQNSKFVFCTPQTLENDVISNIVDLNNFSLMIFDEAHRATGNYAYVFLAQRYISICDNPLILALSASPGTDKETINNVIQNLFIENVEFKSSKDDSILEYVQGTKVTWEEVELTNEIKHMINYLNNSTNNKIIRLKELGFADSLNKDINKLTLLKLQNSLQSQIASGIKTIEMLTCISVISEIIKLTHACELIETQSLHTFYEYAMSIIIKSKDSKVKSIKNVAQDRDFLSALSISRDLISRNIEHPKIEKLKEIIKNQFDKNKDSKIIIFTQFRDTASIVKTNLDDHYTSNLFLGQNKKKGVGLTQKKQKELIEDFSNSKFQILIATSVAEEGLDIPSVDLVIFYEPIPSAIRTVQRRGRTGRHTQGIVKVLVSKGTRDESYRWSSFHKEKQMLKNLEEVSTSKFIEENTNKKTLKEQEQKSLNQFSNSNEKKEELEKPLTIYVDYREKSSSLLKELVKQNVDIKLKQLEVGDYLISSQCVIEFKNVKDFVDSIVDGRIFEQLNSLTQYSKPIYLIQGIEDIYSIRNVNSSAIDGALATISTKYRVPIFFSKSEVQSARYILAIAKKEQIESENKFIFHHAKPQKNYLLQEYIISAFPNIGATLAENILTHFNTLDKFLNATKEELLQVKNLGEKTAEKIIGLKHQSYKENKEKEFHNEYRNTTKDIKD